MQTGGDLIGPYRIISSLRKGEPGEVYRVLHLQTERELSLKVLRVHSAFNHEGLKLLELQAKALDRLSHKNILAINDVGIEKDICYVVTPLIEGQTLQSLLSKSQLPWYEAVQWTIQIAEGLSAAHSLGIVHSDLNPNNVYRTSDGCIKILNFGLAYFSRPRVGSVIGSVPYFSPEQVTGDEADFRSDIFSLGCVLYEMISGRCPFARSSVFETANAILKEEPQKLSELKNDTPLELDRVISHCLEKKRGARFPSARDLIFELRQVLDLWEAGSKLPKNRHLAAAIAAIVIVIILMYLKFCDQA